MNEVMLITGAALRLGAAITKCLHDAGYRVVVHYQHSAREAAALVAVLNATRADSAYALAADLRDAASVVALVELAAARWKRLDGLINNAAVFRPTPIGGTTLEDWSHLFDVNLRAPFLLAQSATPWLRQHGGTIVNVTDIYADRPKANHAVYSATKSGLAGLTRALALDLGPAIRVNAVAPGAILWPDMNEPEEQARLLGRTPLGRPGTPGDIAGAVLYCVQAPYVTGQVVAVDGGRGVVD